MPYRPTAKTELRRVEDRERVVAAAHALVARGGFRAASIAQVARRSKLAVGSVYRHFPSKGELFAEVFRRASGREVEVTARAGDGREPPAVRLARAVERFARRALEAPALAYALLAEPVDPAVERERLIYRRAYREVFASILREGIARRQLPPFDVEVCSAALVGAIGEALIGPLTTRRRSPDQLVHELVRFTLRSVSAEEKAHVRSVRRTA
jgi:AcrR family transcriptional regulator